MTGSLFSNGDLVAGLRRSLRSHDTALAQAPKLLRTILESQAWREFETPLGEVKTPSSFRAFVEADPDDGLGATMDLIDDIVGTDDADLLRALKRAKAGKPGRPRKGETPAESAVDYHSGARSDYLADALADDHPEQYEAVRSGELSINAAAVLAGIRPRRVSVRVNDPASVARSLRKHMTPEQVARLAQLLTEEERPMT
jgi:hypothetical protein